MWLAKDLNGTLTVFENKPERSTEMWIVESGPYFGIPKYAVDINIKFDDEPVEIEIKIK